MLTIYLMWKKSLNIEIHLKLQNYVKIQSINIIRNNISKHTTSSIAFSAFIYI